MKNFKLDIVTEDRDPGATTFNPTNHHNNWWQSEVKQLLGIIRNSLVH